MTQTFTSFQEFKRRYPIRPNNKGDLLGSGSYGRVIKVEDQLETEWVAIKVSEFKGNDTKSLKSEVELAQRVPRQANIARYDACHRLETDTSISDFAIMKYYPDGNLADLLRNVTLTPTQIYDITQGILLGLQHLHKHRIVHRDFKPANILISRDNAGRFVPKIADFGLSKLVSEDELDSSDFDLSDGRGTPSYKAPEQIEGSRVSFNLDLWAFGVILYEIMTGEKPFKSDSKNSSEQSVRREIERKIITVELPARLSQVSQPYRSIIQRCLVRDIHERVRKEDELLDLLDGIPQLMAEANAFFDSQQYKEALGLFEQVLAKREHYAEAQKGVAQCKTALEQQHINNLLNDANGLIAQQQFEKAKSKYEQVLCLRPTDAQAVHGLALCIDRLRPKPIVIEPELTDAYQEESTDIYAAPLKQTTIGVAPIRTTIIESTTVKPPVNRPLPEDEPFSGLDPDSSIRPFPQWVTLLAIMSMAAFIWYINSIDRQKVKTNIDPNYIDKVNIAPPAGTKPSAPASEEMPKTTPLKGQGKIVVNKQSDIYLGKAKQAFERKDYQRVLALTNSALHLDPTRREVAALRDVAIKELQKKTLVEDKLGAPAPLTAEPPKIVAPTPETEKPSDPIAKDNPTNAKQEAQYKYDQLIEDGLKAIAKGNNKEKAIDNFINARSLAQQHELNTAKADVAYTTYLAKANRIFENEEEGGTYEGAKGWYKVAQALKDTREVQQKIKQCTNQ